MNAIMRHAANGALGLILACASCLSIAAPERTVWSSDNGNGTYSNPIFYDDFPDPDLIRVGADYYMTGSTMHNMPGLPILHSRDLVNWEFMSYASSGLDFGPEYRLEDGANIYGRGIWAPSLRYRNGRFHVFANVNGRKTQVYTASDPRGPWTHHEMKRSLHDLSVLFDDDGKTYVIWGYETITLAELNDTLTDIVPGSERVIIDARAGMGEGSHFYKIKGKYYITSARWDGKMRMPAARADAVHGPYEVHPAISHDEDFGLPHGNRLRGRSPFLRIEPGPGRATGSTMLHQGGIVDTPDGHWWGFSMGDANSLGRLTHLSPVTWSDGWPYFGLPGNLGRTPRTWTKPVAGFPAKVPYVRDDDFGGPALNPVWQWNHAPDDTKWSLTQQPGHLRLFTSQSRDLLQSRNTLVQRAMGPRSVFTARVDASGLKDGAVGGVALLGVPYAYIGVKRAGSAYRIVTLDQGSGDSSDIAASVPAVWLRISADFLAEKAALSYSYDGVHFTPFGATANMAWQLTTFQGVRYGLFSMAESPTAADGYLAIDKVSVTQPDAGTPSSIPLGEKIAISFGGGEGLGRPHVEVTDMRSGRVALRYAKEWLTVEQDGTVVFKQADMPGKAQTFQWMTSLNGDLMLMSLLTHRYLRLAAAAAIKADAPGAGPELSGDARLRWTKVSP